MAFRVEWAVRVDGNDVSSFMRPTLQTIEVEDRDGVDSDACRLTFDDAGGQIALPAIGKSVEVLLNGVVVFAGMVDQVRSDGTRGGGRTLSIDAKGIDTRGKVKERQAWHMDDATLEEVLQKAAKQAGIEITVDPELGAITRDYWSPDRKHFLEYASDLAEQHGATFKVRNGKAAFVKRGAGTNAKGETIGTIEAKIPGNVISWSLSPDVGRPRFSKTRTRYFDRPSAAYITKEVEVENGEDSALDVDNNVAWDAADADEAENVAKGQKTKAERDASSGSITLDLTPDAMVEGTLVLSGARPGIDGSYRIVSVSHRCDRNGGSTTTLELRQPQGDVGKDTRVPIPTPRPSNVPTPTARPTA